MYLKGGKEFIRKMNRLGDKKKMRKVLRKGTTAASQIIAKAVQKVWKSDANRTGFAARKVTKKIAQRKSGFTGIIGTEKDAVTVVKGKPHIPSKIDHLVELGFQHPNGRTVPGIAPLRRGFAASIGQAESVYEKKAASEIEKEAKKK